MPDFIQNVCKKKLSNMRHKEHGQSLVEMAIVTPLLLFIFLGLIEVGWALRGQLTLQTANRETARFASRGEYLDFDKITDNIIDVKTDVGYNIILTHTEEILASNYLGFDIDTADISPSGPNGSIILSHYLIDTGYPCHQSSPTDDCSASCASGDYYVYDDLILHPGVSGYEHFSYTEGISVTASRLDYETVAAELIRENNELNCKALARSPYAEMSINSVVVSEAFYSQPHLLGVPLISNQLTNPVPLYNQTTMRISPQNGNSQGEGCELLPIALQQDSLNGISQGDYLQDIREGSGSGQFGWLRWRDGKSDAADTNGDTNSEQYLAEEIVNPRLSIHDYINPLDPTDTVLNAANPVWGLTGQAVGNDVRDALSNHVGQTVSIPVYSTVSGNGSNATYQIVGFIYVRLIDISLTGNPKTISAQYTGPNLNCPTSELTTQTNNNPTANDDGPVNVVVGDQIAINIIANDQNVAPNSVTITNGPAIGSANYDSATGVLTYQAPVSIGPASKTTTIDYEACNIENICVTATVTVVVTKVAWTPSPTPQATDTPVATNTPAATETPTNTPTPTSTPAVSLIAWDTFEDSNRDGGWIGNNWSVSGDSYASREGNDGTGAVYQGSLQARMYGNTTIQRYVDLGSKSSAELTFAWRANSFEGGDDVVVRVYDGSWHDVLVIDNGDDDNQWHVAQIDLSGYNLINGFGIAFVTDISGDVSRDQFYIDDVEITGG